MSVATHSATIMDHVNLAFADNNDEDEPAPSYWCATFGSSLSRAEKLQRLKNLEDAGYNRAVPPPSTSTTGRWDDDLVNGLAAMSERDLANFLASKSDEDRALIARASRRVKLRAETGDVIKDMERMSDSEMQAMLAQMTRAERAALAEIVDAWQ